jgi:16S rRNA (cytidine1402-2'-O)-methyltransferase
LPVLTIPGPSSITAALSVSSIPHDKFTFLGYFPRKHNERIRLFEKLEGFKGAIVFFESPFRILAALRDIKEIVGNKNIAVIRELTKKFEEILESDIDEAIAHFEKTKPRGEFVVIVDDKEAPAA